MAAIILHEDSEVDDYTGWNEEASGEFSISSAYDIVVNVEEPIEAAKWNSIWKLKVPNRIRTFLWLVRHGRILTNSNRVKRGVLDCDKCWCCNNMTTGLQGKTTAKNQATIATCLQFHYGGSGNTGMR